MRRHGDLKLQSGHPVGSALPSTGHLTSLELGVLICALHGEDESRYEETRRRI